MDLLTVKEAASMLRVSEVTLRRYVASGTLPAVRVGRNIRIDRSAAAGLAMPTTASRSNDLDDEASTPLPKNGFSPDSPIWDLVGIVDDDGPTDMASDKYKYFAKVYGDRNDE